VPDHLDPVFVGPDGIRPLDLVEDELLLLLPQIPLHESGDCAPPIEVQADDRGEVLGHPFAALTGLRGLTDGPGTGGDS
jgi:uncharacterized metal-binding protein YceD (DUF177 family)